MADLSTVPDKIDECGRLALIASQRAEKAQAASQEVMVAQQFAEEKATQASQAQAQATAAAQAAQAASDQAQVAAAQASAVKAKADAAAQAAQLNASASHKATNAKYLYDEALEIQGKLGSDGDAVVTLLVNLADASLQGARELAVQADRALD